MTFADHFRSVSRGYANHRPTYPAALFDWLAQVAPARELAWDCATGSGQAAVDLARHFARVIATDASAAQIAQAEPHTRIEYRVAPAERSGATNSRSSMPVRSMRSCSRSTAAPWARTGRPSACTSSAAIATGRFRSR